MVGLVLQGWCALHGWVDLPRPVWKLICEIDRREDDGLVRQFKIKGNGGGLDGNNGVF